MLEMMKLQKYLYSFNRKEYGRWRSLVAATNPWDSQIGRRGWIQRASGTANPADPTAWVSHKILFPWGVRVTLNGSWGVTATVGIFFRKKWREIFISEAINHRLHPLMEKLYNRLEDRYNDRMGFGKYGEAYDPEYRENYPYWH